MDSLGTWGTCGLTEISRLFSYVLTLSPGQLWWPRLSLPQKQIAASKSLFLEPCRSLWPCRLCLASPATWHLTAMFQGGHGFCTPSSTQTVLHFMTRYIAITSSPSTNPSLWAKRHLHFDVIPGCSESRGVFLCFSGLWDVLEWLRLFSSRHMFLLLEELHKSLQALSLCTSSEFLAIRVPKKS